MPAISMFYGIIVYMYFMDNRQHNRPHIATLNELNDSSCGSSCFYYSASICVHLRIIS